MNNFFFRTANDNVLESKKERAKFYEMLMRCALFLKYIFSAVDNTGEFLYSPIKNTL